MTLTAFNILCLLSIVLAVGAIIKPAWPLTSVAVLLIAIALLIGK